MSNRISDADIDAILREFSEQQNNEPSTEAASPRRTEAARQEHAAHAEPTRQVRQKKPAPQPERHRVPVTPPSAKKPRAEAQAVASRPVFSPSLVILMIIAILVLAWVGVNVHPGTGTATGSSTETRLDLVGKLDVFINNAASDALENVAYIKKIYTIPESDLVAPEPDPSKFGSTSDPMVVQAVVDSAAELLDGQTLSWNPGLELLENSEIQYYCDDTILVIAWKEVINNSVCTFAEVKIAHGSQLRRALSDNTYGSSAYMYPSDMAENANAVIAINGDFYAFRQLGITVYQRQLYRFAPKNVDSCFFTASGDMMFLHMGEVSEEAEALQFIQDNDITFSVAFGPILVENGELQTIYSYPIGEIEKKYSRSCIGQVDTLHYILMTVNTEGTHKNVATVNQAAEYMYSKNCYNAYALDGGQTAAIVMQGDTVNRVDWDSERTMSDIIYFATALPGEGASS